MLHAVGNYEVNMYHDSYFKTVFWDDEAKTLTTKEIGSTAYGGGSTSTTLTSDEQVWKEVEEYRARRMAEVVKLKRDNKAKRLRDARSALKAAGVHTAFTRQYNTDELEDIAALFDTRVRSKFKLSVREQVREWSPQSEYKTPLTKKQMTYVRRPLTDMYGRPTALARRRDREDMMYNILASEFRGLGKK